MIYGTQEFADLLRDILRDGRRHDLYELTVKHAEEMSVHINGDKPLYLLERNRPREDEEVKIYRIENYEPTTKAGADKAIEIIGKGFNPSLYSIIWKEHTSPGEELERYTLEYYPNYNSIVNFNKDVLLPKMLADPNGIVAIKPADVPDDDTEVLKPVTVVYGSPCIWYYDKDHYLIAMSGNVDKFERDDFRKQEISETFEYYDKKQYLNFTATYDASTKEVSIVENTGPVKHNCGRIPAWPLGGKSKNLDNGKILWQSFFAPALPHWNLAVKHGSDLMASIVGHIFPQKYEVAEECAFRKEIAGMSYACRGGKIRHPGPNGSYTESDCQQCGGSGLVTVKGPLQTYQFLKEKLSTGDGNLSVPPVGYIDVPIDATKFLDEYTDKMNQKAMSAINMDIEEKVGENQSGIAKVIDRTAQNDTIFGIHSRVWDVHTNNEYYFSNLYMNGTKAESTGNKEALAKYLPEVNKPVKFDLLTTSERIFNYKVSKDSGLDRNLLRTQAIGIIKGENGSTPDLQNYQIALVELDPLFGASQEEIDLGVSKGVIKKTDWCIHENVKTFLDSALEADKDFLSKERKVKIETIEKMADELIESEKPRIDEAAMSMNFDQQQDAA